MKEERDDGNKGYLRYNNKMFSSSYVTDNEKRNLDEVT